MFQIPWRKKNTRKFCEDIGTKILKGHHPKLKNSNDSSYILLSMSITQIQTKPQLYWRSFVGTDTIGEVPNSNLIRSRFVKYTLQGTVTSPTFGKGKSSTQNCRLWGSVGFREIYTCCNNLDYKLIVCTKWVGHQQKKVCIYMRYVEWRDLHDTF